MVVSWWKLFFFSHWTVEHGSSRACYTTIIMSFYVIKYLIFLRTVKISYHHMDIVTESYARRSLMQAKHGWPQHIQKFIAFCSQYSLYPVYISALHTLNTSIPNIFCSIHFSHVSTLVFQSTDFFIVHCPV